MNIRIQMYLRLFVVPNKFLSICLPTFFLSLKKHARRCGDKPIYIGAVLEDEKTKEKLVIINSDGVEITSPHLNVRLVPKAEINPKVCLWHTKENICRLQ